MRNFFLNMNNNAIIFKAFSILHVISLVLTFILFIIVLYNKKQLRNTNPVIKKRIRIIFGIILCIFYVLRRGTFIYYGVYNWKYHLSLGFCNMTNILFIIYCLTGNKKIYNLCYYCAFCGPLLSILFPVINISINNYSFINFIVIHHIVFLMNIVFAIFEDKEYSVKDMVWAYGTIITYVLFCYGFNLIFGTHYNLLSQFVIDSVKKIDIVFRIINSQFLNNMVLLFIGMIMVLIGGRVLKLLNGGGANET